MYRYQYVLKDTIKRIIPQPEIHKADDPALETPGEHPHSLCEPKSPQKAGDRALQITLRGGRPLCEFRVGTKTRTVISKLFQKRLCILQVRERNHRRNPIVLVGFGLFYLLEAGFQFCQRLAGQGAGTDVGNESVPYSRHGVVRGIEVIKPAPVLIRNEVRSERIQHLKRKDEHIAKPV